MPYLSHSWRAVMQLIFSVFPSSASIFLSTIDGGIGWMKATIVNSRPFWSRRTEATAKAKFGRFLLYHDDPTNPW